MAMVVMMYAATISSRFFASFDNLLIALGCAESGDSYKPAPVPSFVYKESPHLHAGIVVYVVASVLAGSDWAGATSSL